MVSSSIRRFDLGSASQPTIQFIAATLPLFFVLVWFLFTAGRQFKNSCYDNYYNEQSNNEEICNRLIPLDLLLYVFIAVYFCWGLLVMYLSVFVPWRHALINEYLNYGETVIGNVFVKSTHKDGLMLTSKGYVVYEYDSKRIRRKVPIFERYTRELAAILVLPGLPLSGQPKVDMQIDRDTFEINEPRMKILSRYGRVWIVFCIVGSAYIARTLELIESKNNSSTAGINFIGLFIVIAFFVIPLITGLWIWIAWILYKRWMTLQHTILEDDDELADEPRSGCCFDDQDCESVQMTDYVQMSSADKTNGRKAMTRT
jgi:hypothetical protein